MKNKKLSSLVDEYYLSFDFKSLRDKTKEQYQYFLGVLLDTKIDDAQNLGNINFSDIAWIFSVGLNKFKTFIY